MSFKDMLLNCLELISLIYQQFPVKPQTVGIESYLGTGFVNFLG